MLTNLTPGLNFILSLYMANRPSGLAARITDPTDFQIVEPRPYHLGPMGPNPAGTNYPNACPINTGADPDISKNFHWLPWIPGKVSFVPVPNAVPVITGEMSGCWLVLFRIGGTLCFGHIGTEGNPNSGPSGQAKNAWKIAIARGLITPIKAYQPHATTPGADKVFGGLSVHHNFYTIELTRDFNTYKVVAATRTHRQGDRPLLT